MFSLSLGISIFCFVALTRSSHLMKITREIHHSLLNGHFHFCVLKVVSCV